MIAEGCNRGKLKQPLGHRAMFQKKVKDLFSDIPTTVQAMIIPLTLPFCCSVPCYWYPLPLTKILIARLQPLPCTLRWTCDFSEAAVCQRGLKANLDLASFRPARFEAKI